MAADQTQAVDSIDYTGAGFTGMPSFVELADRSFTAPIATIEYTPFGNVGANPRPSTGILFPRGN